MAFGVFVPVLGLLVAIWLLWGHGVGWLDLGLLALFYSISSLGITIGFHRMFTHRGLEAGPVVRLLLAIGGSIAGQGPVIQWCAVHRRHHTHSDRDGDPHSPHLHGDGFVGMFLGMFHAHMGWLFAPEPPGVARSVPDLVADPVLRFVDRWFWAYMIGGWFLPGAIAGLITHSWWAAFTGFIWGGLVRNTLHHHVTWSINSVCHVWGSRPYQAPDMSCNNPIFGLLAFGEGWHNNHHAFPTSARHGLEWWQLDLAWVSIRAMKALGLVRNVRLPGPTARAAKRRRKEAPAAAEVSEPTHLEPAPATPG